jgi:isocitrate dehydrogenase kinase/phosphatase
MKNQDKIRAKFEFYWNSQFEDNDAGGYLRKNTDGSYVEYCISRHFEKWTAAWQACQQLNNDRIAAKDAEIARLREYLEKVKETYPTKGHLDAWIIAKQALEATND